jgi:hypothetical protein
MKLSEDVTQHRHRDGSASTSRLARTNVQLEGVWSHLPKEHPSLSGTHVGSWPGSHEPEDDANLNPRRGKIGGSFSLC